MTRHVPSDDEFRAILTGEIPGRLVSATLRRVPSSPRCKLCAAPFEGVGGAVFGTSASAASPESGHLRTASRTSARRVDRSGDPGQPAVRRCSGVDRIAESMRPTEFRGLPRRVLPDRLKVILGYDGLVDKLVGDEVIGLFFGGVSGHATRAPRLRRRRRWCAALGGRRIADRPIPMAPASTRAKRTSGPLARKEQSTTSRRSATRQHDGRLASSAAAGEILHRRGRRRRRLRGEGLERRNLEVRGRHGPIDVVVIRP